MIHDMTLHDNTNTHSSSLSYNTGGEFWFLQNEADLLPRIGKGDSMIQ